MKADMASHPDRELRFAFDEAAELYRQVRPTYPLELIEDLIRESRLRPGARILEIGAGPGTASVLFAGRGYRLLCLEPGARLAEIAKRRLASDADVRVAVTTFEEWPIEPEPCDLLFAAQSFHWIDPGIRFSKAARALGPGGTLAIFANRPLRGASPAHLRIQQAYARHAPELMSRGIETNTPENFLKLFAAAPDFGQAQCREYEWREEYDGARYLALLRTHSDHRLLPADRLRGLLGSIREAIEASGGRLGVDYVSVLCWARRRD
jgi:SAM-dependent methyltransferase